MPLQPPHLYDYPCHDLYDIQIYLTRALEIIEMGAPDSAVCSSARTAEAVMRLVAKYHSIDFEPQSPAELTQTFLKHGLITQDDYEVLVTAFDIRDAIMHKREQVPVDPKFAYQTVEVVQHLISQAGLEDEI